jgi:hypothetical protein
MIPNHPVFVKSLLNGTAGVPYWQRDNHSTIIQADTRQIDMAAQVLSVDAKLPESRAYQDIPPPAARSGLLACLLLIKGGEAMKGGGKHGYHKMDAVQECDGFPG